MIRRKTRSSLAVVTVLGMLLALLPLTAAPAAGPVAYDMVGSGSSGLIGFTNPFKDAFGSAADGFQKYQRSVSPSIPYAVLDDSLSIYPADSLGIIKDGNTDVFFGVTDTENPDNSGPVTATWVFDIAGASDLSLSIDMGAMGDFESSDFFEWKYSIDGGPVLTAFASTVDESGSYTYTLEGGSSYTLFDPMLMQGTILTDDLATFSAPITGSGSELTVQLTASTDGGSETFAFQTLIVNAGVGAPLGALGAADPDVVRPGESSLLTVAVTPASGPTSSGIGVVADLSSIGGSSAQPLFDDATNGDVSAGDNVFSYLATIGAGTPGGAYDLPAEASDAEGRTAGSMISVQVVGFLTVMEIQGSGQFSPVVGDIVETSGVVTAFNFSGRDMWIQDPVGDGDPLTSDGIFVDDANRLPGVQIGDLVVVRGEVEEQQFGNALPLTRIDDTELIEIVSSGNPLPAPVLVMDLPNVSMVEGEAFWEPLEGMLVTVEDAIVVAPTNAFWEFGMLTKTDAHPGSGYLPQVDRIFVTDLGDGAVDYNPERIMADDAINRILVQAGDRVNSLTGIVDYTFSNYKLQPTEWDIDTQLLPAAPVSTRSGGGGDLTVTTFNVENLFDLVLNPAKDDASSTPDPDELETQLAKLALAIEIELDLPDIIVVQEIENQTIAQELADLVNAAAGTGYVATSFETSDARGIEAGFLWDANRVSLADAFQMSGPNVEAAFGMTSPSPGREPIVGYFEVDGTELIIIGNHFKSKGGDDPLYGVVQPPVRITEVQRKLQAQVVRDFVDNLLVEDPEALVIVAGDLNDFQFAEPGEGAAHPVGILEGRQGSVPLTNLIYLEKEKERYSFLFDGNSQILDYMLVSPALVSAVQGADFLHFNAGIPAVAFDDDPTTPLGASDHDPLEARFKMKLAGGSADDGSVRFATFNASLNRFNAGDLASELAAPGSPQPATIAEIVQRNRPEVLLINEFDYDAAGLSAQLFNDNYLNVSQNGAPPIDYPYWFVAPSNTGVPSGFDLDNSGSVGGPDDAFGFGFFPGQYGMVVYSMYPIDDEEIRTFQNFLWDDMPGAMLPDDPATPEAGDWYSPEELEVLRLSSKSHWDVPVVVEGETVHFLVSHPTPPVFDGPEDRNGRRNHDEIRFWADYIAGGTSAMYIYDDAGGFGGLGNGELFVIAGDQNSDPLDGDSIPGSAQLLIDHNLINARMTPASLGGPEQSELQGLANDSHLGDPAYDTADFNPFDPGNLRVDYILPRVNMRITDGAVFWPEVSDPLFWLAGTFPFPGSDHRLVWIDLDLN